MQGIFPSALAMLLVGGAVAYFLRERREEKRLRLRVKKLYASQLFEDMLPLLQMSRKRSIEQLIVDKTGVVIRYLNCNSGESAFLMWPNWHLYFISIIILLNDMLKIMLPMQRITDTLIFIKI